MTSKKGKRPKKTKKQLEQKTDRIFHQLIKLTFDYLIDRQQYLWFNNCEHCPRLTPSLTLNYRRTNKTFEWLRGCSRSVTVIKFLRRYLSTVVEELQAMTRPDFDFDPRIFEIIETTDVALEELHRSVETPLSDPDQQ